MSYRFLLYVFCLSASCLFSQEAILSSGGNIAGSNGNVSFSVGQVFYVTNANSQISIAEGVQQPYEISIITEVENAKPIDLRIMVYPNPTKEILSIDLQDFPLDNLRFKLFDLQGKMLMDQLITENNTHINVTHLPKAVYVLTVSNLVQDVKSFKIIKN